VIRDFYARFRVLIHEVTKFGIVGILAFVITIVGANVLKSWAHLGPLTAPTISTIVATIFAYLGNKYWTFRHRQKNETRRELVLFVIFNAIGLGIQDAVVATFHYGLGLTHALWYNVSLVLGVGIGTVFRLYTYRRWVFTNAPAEPPAAEQLEPETTGS
jgi:putative flippase GtrA